MKEYRRRMCLQTLIVLIALSGAMTATHVRSIAAGRDSSLSIRLTGKSVNDDLDFTDIRGLRVQPSEKEVLFYDFASDVAAVAELATGQTQLLQIPEGLWLKAGEYLFQERGRIRLNEPALDSLTARKELTDSSGQVSGFLKAKLIGATYVDDSSIALLVFVRYAARYRGPQLPQLIAEMPVQELVSIRSVPTILWYHRDKETDRYVFKRHQFVTFTLDNSKGVQVAFLYSNGVEFKYVSGSFYIGLGGLSSKQPGSLRYKVAEVDSRDGSLVQLLGPLVGHQTHPLPHGGFATVVGKRKVVLGCSDDSLEIKGQPIPIRPYVGGNVLYNSIRKAIYEKHATSLNGLPQHDTVYSKVNGEIGKKIATQAFKQRLAIEYLFSLRGKYLSLSLLDNQDDGQNRILKRHLLLLDLDGKPLWSREDPTFNANPAISSTVSPITESLSYYSLEVKDEKFVLTKHPVDISR